MPKLAGKLKTFRFDQLAKLVNNRVDDPAASGVDRYVGLEHLDADSLRIRRWGEITDVESTKLRFEPGDIIFGKRRVYQRKLAVADFEGICSAHAMVLRANDEVVLPEFLPFFMQSDRFMERALAISVGSLSPTINWSDLAQQDFAVPSIDEQQRATLMLKAVSDASDKYHSLLIAAETCHRALCRHLFSIGAEGRPPAVGELKAGWRLERLDTVSDFLDGQRVPLKSSDRAKRPGTYPYYGASGIIDHIDGYIFDECLVLLSEDGANLVDRTTPIAFEATGQYWVNNHAHVLRIKPPLTNSYIIEYIESLSLIERISGTAQPKLNKAACEELPIPVPPDGIVDEIVTSIECSRKGVAQLRDRLQRMSALRKQLIESVCGLHEVNE